MIPFFPQIPVLVVLELLIVIIEFMMILMKL